MNKFDMWIQKDDGSYYFVTTYKTNDYNYFTFYKPVYQRNSEIFTKPLADHDLDSFFERCKPSELYLDDYDMHNMIWELFKVACK